MGPKQMSLLKEGLRVRVFLVLTLKKKVSTNSMTVRELILPTTTRFSKMSQILR